MTIPTPKKIAWRGTEKCGWAGMSSAVAPAIVKSEPMHSPITARNRIGSNGSSMPVGRAGVAGGTSLTSWIGGTVWVGISAGVRLAGDERLLLVEPLRQHHAGD